MFLFLLSAHAGAQTIFADGFEPVPVARVVVNPAGVLLTGVGDSEPLAATAFDALDNPLPDPITWSSNNPAVVSVNASGTVLAAVAAGTAKIRASAGGVQSAPVYVYIAAPVPGAVLINDGQVISGPTPVNPNAEPDADNPYEVVLSGIANLPLGSIVINTGALVVGGQVTQVTPQGGGNLLVRLVVVPPQQLFTNFAFNDTVDLNTLQFETPADIDAAYDVVQSGNTFVYTPTPAPTPASARARSTPKQGGTQALPPLPPFKECEASAGFGSGLPIPLSLSTQPAFSLQVNGTLINQSTPQGRTFTVQGTPVFTINSVLEISSAFEAKIGCKATLHRKKVRVPGWAGLFFGGDIEFGVGFEVGGKVTLVSAKVGGTATITSALEAGINCPNGNSGCALTGSATATTTVTPTFQTPNLNQLRLDPTVKLFGFVAGELGNADIQQLQFKAIEATVGGRLGASYTLEALQVDNTDPSDGRSKYDLAIEGEVGPGIKLGEFLEYVGLADFVPLKLGFSLPLGESPTSTTITADHESYNPGAPAVVRVQLDPSKTMFLGIYNVDKVVAVRKDGSFTTQDLASQTATAGQTDFTLSFTSPALLDAEEIFAFVVPKFLGFAALPRLELGAAVGTSAIQVAGGTFRNHSTSTSGTAMLVRLRNPDATPVATPVQLSVQGPPGWNGGAVLNVTYPVGFLRQFYALAPAPVTGTYTVSGTVDGAQVSDPFTVDAAVLLGSPGVVVPNLDTSGSVGSSWNAVSGAASYLTRVFDFAPTPNGTILSPVQFTSATSATLNGVPLTGNSGKALQVFAFSNDMQPADPPIPTVFNLSFDRTFINASVVVTPAAAARLPGQVLGLSAAVTGLPSTAVEWFVTGGSLSSSGNTAQWTAPAASGTYTITAQSLANSSFRGRSNVTVTNGSGCVPAEAANLLRGGWRITGVPIATGGVRNCSTVPEFAGFLNGGQVTISGVGPTGTFTIGFPGGLVSYTGNFLCPASLVSAANFGVGTDPSTDPNTFQGQINLQLAGFPNVQGCTALIGGTRQ